MRNIQKLPLHFARKRTHGTLLRVIVVAVMFASAAVVTHGASTWLGPAAPPTEMSTLDTIIDLRDFISTSKLERQFVQGPLYVRNKANANTDQYPARFGLDASFAQTKVTTNFGKKFSMAIGTDGLPVIAYYGNDNFLKVIKCTNPLCTAINGPHTVDPTTYSNFYVSMAIGSDGFPIIAYHTEVGSTGQLRVVHCTDSACSTPVTPLLLDSSASVNFGRYPSIAIGTDDFPVISYWSNDAGPRGGLTIIHCGDIPCMPSRMYGPTVVDGVSGGGTYVGQHQSMTINASGHAVIAYRGSSSSSLKRIPVNCTGGPCVVAAGPYTVAGSVSEDISIAINPADGGRPVFAFYDDNKIYYVRCGDLPCSSITKQEIAAGSNKEEPSLAVGMDGLPVIAYYDATADVIKVAHCANVSCTALSPTTPATIDANSAYFENANDSDVEIAIGSDGFPVIVYRYDENDSIANPYQDHVVIVHCADVACQQTGYRRVGVLGIGDGTATAGVIPSITQNSNIGLMGYTDNASGYGIYLSSLLGTALNARVDEAGEWAGQFYGPVQVVNPPVGNYFGDLSVESIFTASSGIRASSSPSFPSVDLLGSRGTTSPQAIRGITSGGIAGYGIQAMSTAASSNEASISLAAYEESQALFGQSNTAYGILGLSDTKNGILAEATASGENIGAQGTSVDYGAYGEAIFTISSGDKFGDPGTQYSNQPAGVGVFACTNGAFAGLFEGDVRVAGQLDMGVRNQTYVVNSGGSTVIWKFITPDVSLTEFDLQSVWGACLGDGGCTGSLPAL